MNEKIKEIYLKHCKDRYFVASEKAIINKMFIEICELQKNECATYFDNNSTESNQIKNSKNIAE